MTKQILWRHSTVSISSLFLKDKPNKGEMHPQPPMFSTALQANPNPIGDRHPLRIVSATLEAFLVTNIVSIFHHLKRWNIAQPQSRVKWKFQRKKNSHYFHLSAGARQVPFWSEGWPSAIVNKILKLPNLGWDSQYVAEGRLLNCGRLQASATFL